jgi:hypothetical protein
MKIKQAIKKFFGPWEVRRTIWPYKDGYGTYNASTRTIADTGLSREEAQQRCDSLNLKGD